MGTVRRPRSGRIALFILSIALFLGGVIDSSVSAQDTASDTPAGTPTTNSDLLTPTLTFPPLLEPSVDPTLPPDYATDTATPTFGAWSTEWLFGPAPTVPAEESSSTTTTTVETTTSSTTEWSSTTEEATLTPEPASLFTTETSTTTEWTSTETTASLTPTMLAETTGTLLPVDNTASLLASLTETSTAETPTPTFPATDTPSLVPSAEATTEAASLTPTVEPTPSTTVTATTTFPIREASLLPVPHNMTSLSIYSDTGLALSCDPANLPNCKMGPTPAQAFTLSCGAQKEDGSCLTFRLGVTTGQCLGARSDGQLVVSVCSSSSSRHRWLSRSSRNLFARAFAVSDMTASDQHWTILVPDDTSKNNMRMLVNAGQTVKTGAGQACLVRRTMKEDPTVITGLCSPSAGLSSAFYIPLEGETVPAPIEAASGTPVGLIIGCSVGGLCLLGTAAAVGFWGHKRKMEQKWEEDKISGKGSDGKKSPTTPTTGSSQRTAFSATAAAINAVELDPRFHHTTPTYPTSRAATSSPARSASPGTSPTPLGAAAAASARSVSPQRSVTIQTPTTASSATTTSLPSPVSMNQPALSLSRPAQVYSEPPPRNSSQQGPRPNSEALISDYVEMYNNDRPPPLPSSTAPILPIPSLASPFDPRPNPTESYIYVDGRGIVPVLSTSPMTAYLSMNPPSAPSGVPYSGTGTSSGRTWAQ